MYISIQISNKIDNMTCPVLIYSYLEKKIKDQAFM